MALSLAKQEEYSLLTGDKDLREAAMQENIEVSGTLWLMQRLFDDGILTVDLIEEAYTK